MRTFFGKLRGLLARFTNTVFNEDKPEDELKRRVEARLQEVCADYVVEDLNNRLYMELVKNFGSERTAVKIICCFAGFLTPVGLAHFIAACVDLKCEKDVLYFYRVWKYSEEVTRSHLRRVAVVDMDDLPAKIPSPDEFLESIRTYARNRAIELSREPNRRLLAQYFPMD